MIKNKLAVIGVGSAGIQSLCHFLAFLDETWEVYSIHNPSKKILGIGESSNPGFIHALEIGLGLNLIDDLEKLNGTLKFGTKYTNWRNHEFVNPLIKGSVAIHFDTNSLYEFAMDRLKNRWGGKFITIEGDVSDIKNNDDNASLVLNEETHKFDYIMDCSGTPKSFDDFETPDPLLNTCMVHNTKSGPETINEFTEHIATKDGWMFRVPLANRISYGYLYNSNITNDEDAKKNFSDMIGVEDLQDITYRFNPYYSNKIVDGRIIKNGNAAFFFEPMFANSLWVYNNINKFSWDYFLGNSSADELNSNCENVFINVMSMIAWHYMGGSNFPTEFWEYAKKWSTDPINRTELMKEHKILNKRIENNSDWVDMDVPIFDAYGFNIISKNLGYN